MKLETKPRAMEANEEISALIETLLATEQRLEELTGGEVDTVTGRDGRMFLLRRAQEELRYSNAARQTATLNELQVLFDLMPAMIWFKDTEDRILRVNQRVADIAGKSIEEIEGKPSSENYPEAARHYQDDLEVIRSGRPKMGIVETIRNRNGDEVWIQTDKVPYCDKDGKVIGVVVLAQDITERKRTDEKLRASEERFRLLAKATNDAIWDWNVATNALWWNDGIENLFGYQRDQLEPTIKSWTDCIHPDDLARVTDGLNRAMASGLDVWTDEYRFRCQDGSYAYVLDRGHIIRNAAGLGVRMIGGMTDLTERKRIEDSLRASQANMAAAQRIAHFGSWEMELAKAQGVDANVLRWSDEMFRIAGYEPGAVEVSNALFFRLVHPDDCEPIRQAVAAAIRERRDYSITHRLIRPDGQERIVREMAQIFFDEPSGQPLKIVGTAHDITERRLFQAALQESQQRFAGAFEHAPIGVALVSTEGRWLKVNRALCELVGRAEADLLLGTFQDITHPDDLAPDLEKMRQLVAGEIRAYQMEKRYFHGGGHLVTVLLSVSLVRDSEGQPCYFISQIQDITERKQAEETRARLAAIVESSSDAIVGKTLEGIITSWNAGAERLFGYAAQEIIGQPIATLIPPDHRGEEAEFLARLRRDTRIEHFETIRLTKDGRRIEVSLSISPVRDAAGRLIGASKIARDITERKRAEAALEQAHRALIESSRQAGMAEVANGVLHNVGNVLNSVNVASNCLAESLRNTKAAHLSKVAAMLHEHAGDLGAFLTRHPKGKQIPAYLAQLAEHLTSEQTAALRELAHLQKNIEHIKEVVTAQQTGAKAVSRWESLQAAELVEDTLRMDSNGEAHRDIQIVRDFANTPAITVEKHKVLQILMNLVRNAKQSCQASARADQRLTLRVTREHDCVRIAVSDNGLGISPENLAHVFAHGFTTKKEGHGFGLHSAALAAREMGGALRVQSGGLGQGAVFTLELPLQASTHAG